MTCWSSKCFYNLFFNLLRTLFRFVLVYPFAHLRNMKGTLCAQIKGEYHWVCHVLGFGGKLAGNGFLPFSSKRWFCICLTDSDCIINMQMLNFNRILLTHIVSNLQIMFYIYICTDFFVLHVGCNKKKTLHFKYTIFFYKNNFIRTRASDFSKIKNNSSLILVELRTKTRFSLK